MKDFFWGVFITLLVLFVGYGIHEAQRQEAERRMEWQDAKVKTRGGARGYVTDVTHNGHRIHVRLTGDNGLETMGEYSASELEKVND